MTEKLTQISGEDLAPVVQARAGALELAAQAEKAYKDARVAELEYKVKVQELYISKGLDANCRIDMNTGTVTWPEDLAEAAVPETAAKEDEKPKRQTKKKTTKKAVAK